MRIEKRGISNIGGMFCHNERKTESHSNDDIDVSKSHLNYQLIECKSYKEKINKEIQERYRVNKSIRKDAVLCAEVLFTSDKNFFDKLTKEQEKLYFEKSVEFLKEKFGEKNVIFATVHKDETTPHLHAGVIPLTDDGRLSYKSFVSSKIDLVKLQDEYYKKISEFFPELERGKSSDGKRKHLSVEEFKLNQEKKQIEIKKNEIENLKKSWSLEEKKFYNLKDIKNHVKENKGFFQNKITVSMDKEIYNSLMKYASEGEKILQENIKLENELEDYKKISTSKVKKLETEILGLTEDNEKLKNKNLDFEEKVKENKKLEKLKNWLPKETIETFEKEQEEQKKVNAWSRKIENKRGRGLGR